MLKPDVFYGIYSELLRIFPQLNLYNKSMEEIYTLDDKIDALLAWKKINHYAFSLVEIDYSYDIPLPFVNTYLELLNAGHQPKRITRIHHDHDDGVARLQWHVI